MLAPRTLVRVLPVAVSVLGLGLVSGCGSSDSSATGTSAGATTSTSPSASPTTSTASPDASGSISLGADGPCSYPSDGTPAVSGVTPPPASPTVSGTTTATIATNIGNLSATLDATKTPCTVNSFLSLASQGFYDDTPCHRLTTQGIYVLQCGDPTGTGTGGPGYTIPDELSGSETYPAGTLAMAKTPYPNSGGSQFFIVYKDTQLPPQYTVFGTVDDAAVKAVEQVAKAGTNNANGPGDGAPNTSVTITSISTS